VTIRELADLLTSYAMTDDGGHEELLIRVGDDLRPISTGYIGRTLILVAGMPIQ